MKLSSLDIRKQEFTRVVRGFDKEEVDAFLQLVANQWQELVDDLRREEEKTNDLNAKLGHYQKVEEALEQALKTAKDGARQTIDNAEHKARLVIEEAESKSVGITRDAESERLNIRKEAAKYSVRQKEIIAKLRAFLMSELEILAQYESETPVNYIKLIPAEFSELMEKYPDAEDGDESGEVDEIDVTGQSESDSAADQPSEDEVLEEALVDKAGSEEAQVEPKSSSKKKKASRKNSQLQEPEVSDEIAKIRRILEDLEK